MSTPTLKSSRQPTWVILDNDQEISLPYWVIDLESFRRWADSEDFPDEGRVCFLKGGVWVDISKEQLFTHNKVKAAFTMVLEVVSPGSVRKDEVILRQAYWEAGISEYWLVDARAESIRFDIFHHTSKGYVSTRKHACRLKSNVFGKSFQLTRKTGADGLPRFTLSVR